LGRALLCYFRFAAIIGQGSLLWIVDYLISPLATERPAWKKEAMAPFIFAGVFEMLGILLVIVALSPGQVVIVSPIVATNPLWILVGTWLFLRGIENCLCRRCSAPC
jgi:drug/metabolite transporter (DMT)-like permease